MLAAGHRLRRRDEFAAVIRSGRRAGRGCIVVHVLTRDQPPGRASGQVVEARVGFVIPRAVGKAVDRNRIRRRLRHLFRERLPVIAPGTDVVIRVAAGATGRSYAELGADLDAALSGARRPGAGRRGAAARAGSPDRKARTSA